MKAIRFALPGIPWSANERARQHYMALHRHDEDWKAAAYYAALAARNERAPREAATGPFDRARVTLTFLFPTRGRHDPDNYAAAAKGLLDGLVGVLITDDDFGTIELVVAGRWDREAGPAVEVEVEPND